MKNITGLVSILVDQNETLFSGKSTRGGTVYQPRLSNFLP